MITNKWDNVLKEEFKKKYFIKLSQFIADEYNKCKIYPSYNNLYNSLIKTDYDNVKVVILGQDPYHNKGQANGLAFSVNEGVSIPKSLQNIFKELKNDIGFEPPQHGNLEPWAKQGVLLLNTILSVKENQPGSHREKGWEIFTDHIIRVLSKQKDSLVFILWGNYAISKSRLIDGTKHLILTAPHPSPLSAYRGYFGCKHFSKANKFLKQRGLSPIDWNIK